MIGGINIQDTMVDLNVDEIAMVSGGRTALLKRFAEYISFDVAREFINAGIESANNSRRINAGTGKFQTWY